MIAAHDRQTQSEQEKNGDSDVGRTGKKRVGSLLRILPMLRRHRAMSIGALLALTSAAVISLALPVAIRRMVDYGFSQSDAAFMNRYFLMLLVMALALALASAFRYFFVTALGERIVADLRQDLFQHVVRLPARFFDENHSGDIISRLTSDATQIKSAVTLTASVALRNSLLCIGSLAMMFVTSPGLSLMAMLAIPLIVAALVMFGRSVRVKSRVALDTLAGASAYASELIAASRTLQAFCGEDVAGQKYCREVETAYDKAREAVRARAVLTAIAIALIFGSVVGVLWIGAHGVFEGTMSAGTLSQFLLYSVIAAGSLGSLSEVWGELTQAAGSADRVFELLDEVGEHDETQLGVLSQPTRGEIKFTDVHFAYPAAPDVEVIKGFSMSVAPGETVALVGASGSGKTTLLSLLLGFYRYHAGGISVDGQDLSTLSLRSVRSQISVVPQDVTIFAASILENIAFGRPDATREQVISAARRAQAHEFIAKLDQGYETVVGERGMTLSGGQRQRIAIARALLKDAPILLLDEATAALDAENEACVQEALDGLVANRSTIVIAHRLATVLKADRILVVEDGRIVEEGNHAALMRQGGTYARLAKLQFKDSAGKHQKDAA